MKKNLFFLAVAALALASCSNDEVVSQNTTLSDNQPQEIAFSPLAQPGTRAISNDNHGYINGTTFETSWGMTVSAYDITNSREFFSGTNFVYNATPALWNGETHRYWPLSATQINFLAIAHANADNTTGVTWTQDNTPTHQVAVAMSDNYAYNTAQRDFIYAIGAGEVTKAGNALTFPDKVDMTFKHTQAYLVFRVKAADATSTAIHITDIKIKGARTSGTATIARTNAGTYNDAAVSLNWTSTGYHTNASTFESVTATQTAIDYTLTTDFAEKGHLMVVPYMTAANTFNEGGFTSFEISYTLDSKAYTYEYTPSTTLLEAGKKYTYDITFKLHEIFVNPTVTDWENAGTTPVEIPTASIAWDAVSPSFNVGSAAGTYYVNVTGLTAGKTVSVAETSDTNNIISSVSVSPTTVPASGVVTIAITVPISTGANSATITLTNTTDSQSKVITINQPAL